MPRAALKMFCVALLVLLPGAARAAEDKCKQFATTPAPPKGAKKSSKADNSGQTVPLPLVVCEVEQALDAYQQDPDVIAAKIPLLATADFDFKTTTDVKGGISVSFLVFTIKYTQDKQTVHDVDFQYGPKPPVVGFDQQKEDFQTELINTIKAAAKAVKETQDGLVTSENPLVFKQLTVTLSFGVTKDLTVGATIPIHLVTLGPSFEGSKNSVQQVKLVFGDPKKTMPSTSGN
jgi:hypothetical protein